MKTKISRIAVALLLLIVHHGIATAELRCENAHREDLNGDGDSTERCSLSSEVELEFFKVTSKAPDFTQRISGFVFSEGPTLITCYQTKVAFSGEVVRRDVCFGQEHFPFSKPKTYDGKSEIYGLTIFDLESVALSTWRELAGKLKESVPPVDSNLDHPSRLECFVGNDGERFWLGLHRNHLNKTANCFHRYRRIYEARF